MTMIGKKLEHIGAGEVSVVNKGANKKKRFPMFKGEKPMEFSELLKAVVDTESDADGVLDEVIKAMNVPEKEAEAAKAAFKILHGFKDGMPEGFIAKALEGIGLVEEPVTKACADDKKKTQKGAGGQMADDQSEEETTVKKELEGLPEDVRGLIVKELESRDAQLEAIKLTNADLMKALKVEKDARELALWIAKAEEELSHYPGRSSEELGTMLKGLHDQDPKMAEDTFKLLKPASDLAKASGILKEAGTTGGGSGATGSAWGRIEKQARELVQKSAESNFTFEKACNLVMERDPNLYTEYLKEGGN